MQRIPALDGLRAISIAAVVLGHLATAGDLPLAPRYRAIAELFTHFGVRIFFVLSGYLITTLILREREQTGDFSLKKFYARRAWRILPPAYALLLCLWIASLFRPVAIPAIDYLRGFSYLMNYGPVPDWRVAHLWSLSVEEQFYIIWPFLLAFLPNSACRSIAAVFIFVSAGLHYRLLVHSPEDLWRREYQFQYAASAIAFGCLLAIDQKWLYVLPWFRRLCASPLTTPAVCVLLVANKTLLRSNGPVGAAAADIVSDLCILCFVAKLTGWPVGPVSKILNWRPAVFVGGISYSLYLWQQVFTSRATPFPMNLALIVACALGSYSLIEKPSNRIRRALQPGQGAAAGI